MDWTATTWRIHLLVSRLLLTLPGPRVSADWSTCLLWRCVCWGKSCFSRRWSKCRERRLRRCREDTLQREKKKEQKRETKHKNKKLSKFHSGTNVTAQSGASEAPDDGHKTLHLWRRPQVAVMSVQTGSAGFCHAIHSCCPLLIPSRRSTEPQVRHVTLGDNEMSQSTALVRWVTRPLTSALSKMIHFKGW